jgi:hypothetical protein
MTVVELAAALIVAPDAMREQRIRGALWDDERGVTVLTADTITGEGCAWIHEPMLGNFAAWRQLY